MQTTCYVYIAIFQSSKIKRGSQGDISALKPTMLAAVPVSESLIILVQFDMVIYCLL